MKIRSGGMEGLRIIETTPHRDERGFLARTFCEEVFCREGMNTRWPQCNLTETVQKGAIRGMHWQEAPHAEIKLIRCEQGAVWDCLVDIRPDSKTFGKWESYELTSENGVMLYVPEGIAHGFQTLEQNSRLFYMMSSPFSPAAARGLHWNDPGVGIKWPLEVMQVGKRDGELPNLSSLKF